MKFFGLRTAALLLAILVAGVSFSEALGLAREEVSKFAQVGVYAGKEGCTVELDSVLTGKTDATGSLVLHEVEPTDHYLHVRCPNRPERAQFFSARAGESLAIRLEAGGTAAAPLTGAPLEAAEAKIQLRRLIQEAVQMRAKGRPEEAVQRLREASKLDPENSDLHRELGITFLLGKDWKRARVEMLEAVRHKPDDADAHNGLGYALEKLGEIEAAVKEYRIATRLEPDDTSYRQHYLEALGKLAVHQAEKKK